MEDIIKMLSKKFEMISIEQLEDYYYGKLEGKNYCHITIDDGDNSVYSHLFPLLKKYQVPVSIFVSPKAVITGKNFWFQEIKGYDPVKLLQYYNKYKGTNFQFVNGKQVNALIKSCPIDEIHEIIKNFKKIYQIPDKERRCLTIEQLKELQASDLVGIGAHTLHHPILKNEKEDVVRIEIIESINQLSAILGEEVKYFAYPNGMPEFDFGNREINILKEKKIKLAFSTEGKNFSKNDNPLSIPRRGVTKGSATFVYTKLLLGNSWDTIKQLIKGKQEKYYRVNEGV
ncbi:polysaccharide deacetylase family protein [Aquiflexum balticum]|nr:polysaccharide deacetylase family protein [Aquiflexum balticum]